MRLGLRLVGNGRRGRLTDGREIEYARGLFVLNWKGVPEVSHGGATAAYFEVGTAQRLLDAQLGDEPDLVAAAEALGLSPAQLAATRERFAS